MKGIRLSHGVIFVTDGLVTVRLLPSGECGVSPISYNVLEWDLRTESPDKWEYITDADIRSLPGGGTQKIISAFERAHRTING